MLKYMNVSVCLLVIEFEIVVQGVYFGICPTNLFSKASF